MHDVLPRLHSSSIQYDIPDPGDAGTIQADRQFGICHIETAAAETRTLPDPEYAGQQLSLVLRVDGGDCTITADTAVNQAGNTSLVAADDGDHLKLEGVDVGGGGTPDLVWRVVANDGWALS